MLPMLISPVFNVINLDGIPNHINISFSFLLKRDYLRKAVSIQAIFSQH